MSDAYAFGGMHCIFTHHTQAGLFDSIWFDSIWWSERVWQGLLMFCWEQ
jgi:hypothetical protein